MRHAPHRMRIPRSRSIPPALSASTPPRIWPHTAVRQHRRSFAVRLPGSNVHDARIVSPSGNRQAPAIPVSATHHVALTLMLSRHRHAHRQSGLSVRGTISPFSISHMRMHRLHTAPHPLPAPRPPLTLISGRRAARRLPIERARRTARRRRTSASRACAASDE